ncbi:MAG: hypothetical protein JST54_02525 [Deltaproteobacteria bacterium]|nr:hypothetical protein [Deltaproteobacteria bacterium]
MASGSWRWAALLGAGAVLSACHGLGRSETSARRASALTVGDAGLLLTFSPDDGVDATAGAFARRAPAMLNTAFAGDAGALSSPRADHALVRSGANVYVVAGLSNGVPTDDVTSYPVQASGLPDLSNGSSFAGGFGPRIRAGAAVWNDRLYVVGGEDGGGYPFGDAYAAPLASDGSVGTFTAQPSLPAPSAGGSAVALEGALYLVGGDLGFSGPAPNILRAAFQPDGSLGSWVDAGALPTPLTDGASAVVNGRIYYVGGHDGTGTAKTAVQMGQLQADGSLSWTVLRPLTTPRTNFALVVADGYLTAIGGAGVATSEQALILDDGTLGPWLSSPSLPAARAGARAYASGGRVTVLGGFDSSGATDTADALYSLTGDILPQSPWVDAGPLVSGGGTGGWSFMPDDVWALGRFYLVGGSHAYGANPSTDVDVGGFAADGTIGPFADALGTAARFSTARYGVAAVVWNGQLWVIGGMNGSTAVYDVSTAPIHADGTLGDFTSVATLPSTSPNLNVNGGSAIIDHDRLLLLPGNRSNYVYSTRMPVTSTSTWLASSMAPAGLSTNQLSVQNHQGVAEVHGQLYVTFPNVNGLTCPTLSGPVLDGGLPGPFTVVGPNAGAYFQNQAQVWDTSLVEYGGRLYAVGGDTGYNSHADSAMAPALGDGGVQAWAHFSDLPTGDTAASVASYNGHLSLLGGDVNYAQNVHFVSDTNATGGLSAFTLGTAPSTKRFQGALVARGDDLYALGGLNSGGATAAVDHGQLAGDGGLTWTSTSALPVPLSGLAAVATDGCVFAAGGSDGSGAAQTAVYAAPILDGGGLGAFTATSPLDAARTAHGLVAWNGWLYALAGSSGTSELQSVSAAPIQPGCALGAWAPTAGILPSETLSGVPVRSGMSAVAHGGWIYLLGGHAGAVTSPEILRAPAYPDGGLGTWVAETSLSVPREGAGVAAYGDRLYLLGGCLDHTVPCGSADPNQGPLGDTLSAPFYQDGSLGTWTPMANLGAARAGGAATFADGWLVLVGGDGSSGPSSSVQVSRVFQAAPRARVFRRIDLGSEVASVDAVTLQGSPARQGRFDLAARVAPDDGGFGSWISLGSVGPNGTISPVAAGPARFLDLRIDLDDADSATLDRGAERDLTGIDVQVTPTSPATASSSSSGSATGSSSGTSSSTTSGSSGSASTSTGASGSSSSGAASTGGSSGSSSTSTTASGSSSSGTVSSVGSTGSSAGASTGTETSTTGSSSAAASTTGGSSGASAGAGGSSGSSGGKQDVVGCACGPTGGSGGLGLFALALVALARLGRRRGALAAGALVVLAAGSARAEGAATKRNARILVMNLNATIGVDPRIGEVITNRLTAQVQKATGAQVLSSADIQAQLGLAKTKSMVGCTDDQCLAEIGGALGAELMVTGSLAKVGSSISFDAEVVDTAKVRVLRRYSNRIKGGSDEEFFDEADRAVAALFPPGATPGVPPTAAASADASAPPAVTTTATTSNEAASDEAGWRIAVGGTSELTEKGGWGSVAVGRRFSRALTVSALGLYTGAKDAGAGVDVGWVPLFDDAPVHPVVGLEVPVLFASSVLVGVAPHVGVAWAPIPILALQLDVPVMFLANASSTQKNLYVFGQGSVAVNF